MLRDSCAGWQVQAVQVLRFGPLARAGHTSRWGGGREGRRSRPARRAPHARNRCVAPPAPKPFCVLRLSIRHRADVVRGVFLVFAAQGARRVCPRCRIISSALETGIRREIEKWTPRSGLHWSIWCPCKHLSAFCASLHFDSSSLRVAAYASSVWAQGRSDRQHAGTLELP